LFSLLMHLKAGRITRFCLDDVLEGLPHNYSVALLGGFSPHCGVCKGQLGNATAGTDVRIRNGLLSCHECYIASRGDNGPLKVWLTGSMLLLQM
ncbi:hypothetical protein XENOCAPTIV_005138, partial [Xenoophorus captivus]